jgi:hypothetical protein
MEVETLSQVIFYLTNQEKLCLDSSLLQANNNVQVGVQYKIGCFQKHPFE